MFLYFHWYILCEGWGEGYNHIIGKLYIKLTIKVIFWGIIKLKGKLSELSTFELQNEAF